MPLPDPNIVWPPPQVAQANSLYNVYGAWYSGSAEQLTHVYSTTAGIGGGLTSDLLPKGQPLAPRFISTIRQGIQRMFWGAPPVTGQVRGHKLHIPLAGDIASTSADLIYGKAPVIKIGAGKHNATQAALDDMLEEANVEAVMLEEAEVAAAYGGAYVRLLWDPVLADVPLWDVIPPDAAVPDFRSNRLVGVTFWRVLPSPDGDNKTWRHLERHDPGKIMHGLYVSSDPGKLGRRVPLDRAPETAQFVPLVDPADGETIVTGADWLAAEYFPNIRPNRAIRGSALGRSDYSGIEPLFDALDECWTSWIRDLRLGKGRIVVPRSYLQSAGRGGGAYFDADREVYEAVDALGTAESGLQLSVVQFSIRVAEHAQTAEALVTEILRSAGYSAQTFGEQGDIAATATEISSRDAASYRTRSKKLLHVRGPHARLILAALQIYVAKFGATGLDPELPIIDWPDPIPVDAFQQAQTMQLLEAAQSMSMELRVRGLHPEWEDKDVDAEVARIKADVASAMPVLPSPGSTLPSGQPPVDDYTAQRQAVADGQPGTPHQGVGVP